MADVSPGATGLSIDTRGYGIPQESNKTCARVVVSPDGSGDALTIQAGIDLLASVGNNSPCDSLILMPGDYEEDIDLAASPSFTLRCPGGSETTRVQSIVVAEGGTWQFIDLRIAEDFESVFTRSSSFVRCQFDGGFFWSGDLGSSDVQDCTFHGRVIVQGAHGIGLLGCTFTGAPAYLQASGYSLIRDCVFEGPVDTAVVPRPTNGVTMAFERCVFRNVGRAIVPPDLILHYETVSLADCQFVDIAGPAIDWHHSIDAPPGASGFFSLIVTRSRFERCGQAVRWGNVSHSTVTLEADTIASCGSPAIELLGGGVARALQIVDGEGIGVRAEGGELLLDRSVISGCSAAGVEFVGKDHRLEAYGCLLTGNGEGLVADAANVDIDSCIVVNNVAGGITANLHGPAPSAIVTRNTVAANAGTGLLVAPGDGQATPYLVCRRNLVAHNADTGICVEVPFVGSLAWNDAWLNLGGAQYCGYALEDSNLIADPLLCDRLGGDFTISSHSPCAETGWFGLIGALPVGCDRPPPAGITLHVDPSGAGDVATLQAGIALLTSYYSESTHDTLEVAPGHYDETITISSLGFGRRIYVTATGGPSSTHVREVIRCLPSAVAATLTEDAQDMSLEEISPGWHFRGVTITDRFEHHCISGAVRFVDCVFPGVFAADGQFGIQVIADSCLFTGVVRLGGNCGTAMRNSRFDGARVSGESVECDLVFSQCTFVNSDTAVVATMRGDSALRFHGCVFADVVSGIVIPRDYFNVSEAMYVAGSRFTNVAGAAIEWRYGGFGESASTLGLVVTDSRFEGCGQAIHWSVAAAQPIALVRDTIIACGESAIELGVGAPRSIFYYSGEANVAESLLVEGCAGDAMSITLRDSTDLGAPYFRIEGSVIRNNEGRGCVIRQVDDGVLRGVVSAVGNVFEGNDGAGLDASVAGLSAVGNSFFHSDGMGLDCELLGESGELELVRNTVVGSGASGAKVRTGPGSEVLRAVVQNNLFALNAGHGLRLETSYVGSVAFNDAWLNYAGAYDGVTAPDSNLTVDPIFCDLEAGDLTVSSVSPCRPDGPFGQIGAHGAGCSILADAAPSSSPRLMLVPNPARGAIVFSVPPNNDVSTIEVVDVQGRLIWRDAPDASGRPLTWTGVTLGGRTVLPGVYWARFKSRDGRAEQRRFVWLR
jgi:hypothetical protein